MTRLIFALAILLVLTTTAGAENLEYCYKGKGARDGGNTDLAIEYFTLCIDDGNLTQETLATVFHSRGNAYADKGEYDRAIADYTQAIRLKPDNAAAFGNRGTAYYLKVQYDRAIADFTEAIRLRPKDALAFNNRGSAYRKKAEYDRAIADYDRAIADFTQAIALDTLKEPRKAWPFYNRGNTYRAKGQYDRAIADYDKAIRLDPDDADAFYNRGVSYGRKGEYDRAIADYDKAIRLDPDDADAYNNFAWLLATTPDTELRDGRKAVTLATKAVHLNDTAPNRDTLAAAYAEARRFNDAVAEQERAIEMLRAAGKHDKLADLRSRLDLYRQRQPYRE